MVAETVLPDPRSLVRFSDGALGVMVRVNTRGLANDSIVEPVNTYILSPADLHVRNTEFKSPDGRNETALAVARDPRTGLALLSVEGDLKGALEPCLFATRTPQIGDEVQIYHGGFPVDTTPIKSRVTGFSPDGGIIINLVWDNQFEKAPVFNGADEIVGFLSRQNQGEGTWSFITPVKPRFVQESIQKLENHLGANNVSIPQLKTDPRKYSVMRNTTAYRPSDLGFRALFSQANSGYVVLGFNDTIDTNGELTADLFHHGNRSIPRYAHSDPSFKADFMKAKVMAINWFRYTNFNGEMIDSNFGDRGFENAWKELELYGDLEQPVEITATCYFDDNTQPVEKKYTLTAQAVIEDVNGKKKN